MAQVPQYIQDDVLSGGNKTGNEAGSSDPPIAENPPGSTSNEVSQQQPNDPSPSTDELSQVETVEEEISVDQRTQFTTVTANTQGRASTMSYWEEEIIDDDEMIEEVIDDHDTEYEEEFMEEVVTEDNEFDPSTTGPGQSSTTGDISVFGSTTAASSDGFGPTPTTSNSGFGPAATTSAYHSDIYGRSAAETGYNGFGPAAPASNEAASYYPPNGYDAQASQDVENQAVENQELLGGNQTQSILPEGSKPERPQPSPSSCWYWITCLILVLIIGNSVGVGYWLTTVEGEDASRYFPSDRTVSPTMAPSVPVSTDFADVQGNCKLDSVANPNPIDQCLCFGEISIIEPDIRERYMYNSEVFMRTYFEDHDDDIRSCSPQNQALVWISSGDDAGLTKPQRAQRFALATVYTTLGGLKWNNSANWMTYDNFCTWYGVSCTQGDVTELVLGENNLDGTLPPELSLLEKLQFLMVARNKISGVLPVSLFSIPTLGTVDVGNNKITGVIPPSVGDAANLNSLNVENNAMSGRLTRSIGRAANLGYLNLKSNQFESELPIEFFNLQKMRHLDIGDNKFVGTFPNEISNMRALEILTLGPNKFTGTIPTSMASLLGLSYLSVSGIPGLTGRIPAELGFNLNRLQALTISETNISGNIDTSFGRLPSLQSLDFSNNQLRSAIPSELGTLANLVTLNLGNNFLDGIIPESIGTIPTLQQIRLNNNLLEGGIPASFGNLSYLNTLRLEANRLEDRVADGICDLRNDFLYTFVVDCPVEVRGVSGTEIFGVVCDVPACCTECVNQR
eukprot:CAMPEP_0201183168 /NCGR_PEP_ID=MMETSP0851-20130426/123000_1 /ASSEMBLY_ACC=CAM_ASM_000631 /TAXON_ID=183588 /ORGANISM="Pseudo-nitzschia fraudulenta, Strain WWA7" /LENGTH=793 /DNA_ID=CAMNT_0047467857 /DNA_START=74 /DNA_END=2458 /DNA_ORIENTATION=+